MQKSDLWNEYLAQVTSESFVTGLSPFKAKIPKFKREQGLKIAPMHATAPLDTNALQKICVSGSKSFTNRALVMAGLSQKKETRLSGLLLSDDSFWGLYSLHQLGFDITLDTDRREAVIVRPQAHSPNPCQNSAEVYFGMAGTLARFFPAVILQQTRFSTVTCRTTKRLAERPIVPLWDSLRHLGVTIDGQTFPCTFKPSHPQGITQISGATSGQFLSGLLMCAAASPLPVRIERVDQLVQPDYVRMTIQALHDFGADLCANADLTQFLNGTAQRALDSQPLSQVKNPEKKGGIPGVDHYAVEADASTACYFLAWSFLHAVPLKIINMGKKTLQPDLGFVGFLEAMGARITLGEDFISIHGRAPGPIVAQKQDFDFSAMSDQALTAGAVALFSQNSVSIRGVEHIRHHESDRIAGFCQNVTACGGHVDEFNDGFRVHPPSGQLSGLWKTYHDHRFAMAGFLVCSGHENMGLLDPECVSKTAPDFFAQWDALGLQWGQ